METTFDKTAGQERSASGRSGGGVDEGLAQIKSAATEEIQSLIADVQDLVARISDLKDADVAQVRGRVLQALESAKLGLADGAESLTRQARKAASATDDYVHESPWAAIGLAALVGAVVGILASRRS